MAWLEKARRSESAYLTMTIAGNLEQGRGDPGFGDRFLRPNFFRLWVIHIQKPLIFDSKQEIHAARVDGKDAGMMLLRDIALGDKKEFAHESEYPLYPQSLNVDGHERRSEFGRSKSAGPVEMGLANQCEKSESENRD